MKMLEMQILIFPSPTVEACSHLHHLTIGGYKHALLWTANYTEFLQAFKKMSHVGHVLFYALASNEDVV